MARLGFLGLGSFGVLSILPNLMLSDSGTKSAETISTVTLVGSGLMIMSGFLGISQPTREAWRYGRAGLIFQFVPLIFMPDVCKDCRKRLDNFLDNKKD